MRRSWRTPRPPWPRPLVARREEHGRRRQRSRVSSGVVNVEAVLLRSSTAVDAESPSSPVEFATLTAMRADGGHAVDELAPTPSRTPRVVRSAGGGSGGTGVLSAFVLLGQRLIVDDRVEQGLDVAMRGISLP